MAIPKRQVKIQLNKTEPTPLTVEKLKEQLDNIGLNCAATDPKRLKKYKEDVESQFKDGTNQSFSILKHKASSDGSPYYDSMYGNVNAPYLGTEEASKGDWEPDGSAIGYSTQLSTVIFPRNFDFLMQNRIGFAGNKSEERTTSGRFETVDAIKELFIQVGVESSASLVKGLDKTTLNSILSNAIAPLNEGNVQNYDRPDSRVIFLVENYNPVTEHADAIGVLGIDWRLTIKNYKEKKKEVKHDTTLTISTRSVLYDSVEALEGDIQFVKSHFGLDVFDVIPPKKRKLKIFNALPLPNEDTFLQGLPLIAKDEFVDVMVLYSPNLQSVGTLDNSGSDVQSSYSKSITSGFTFSTSQKISASTELEAGVVFAKGKVSIGFELSFTEQWNKSQTETITFTAPPGKLAYTYQGYVLSRTLRYSPETFSYKYVDSEGRFLTNILKTSPEPIVGAISEVENV